jgi:hypothetical protein
MLHSLVSVPQDGPVCTRSPDGRELGHLSTEPFFKLTDMGGSKFTVVNSDALERRELVFLPFLEQFQQVSVSIFIHECIIFHHIHPPTPSIADGFQSCLLTLDNGFHRHGEGSKPSYLSALCPESYLLRRVSVCRQ